MAEQYPARLRAGAAEITPDAQYAAALSLVDRSSTGMPCTSTKAAAVEHFGSQPVQRRPKDRQREVLTADLRDIEAAGPHRGFDLGKPEIHTASRSRIRAIEAAGFRPAAATARLAPTSRSLSS
jgi:hypothetical protein